jgi:hypothetical protein
MWKMAMLIFGSLFLLAGGVRAAQVELDSDVMKNIEDINKSLASNIALGEVKAGSSDARELLDLFAQVEAYFVAKGDAPDAVELSRKIRSLATDIGGSLRAREFSRATDQATDLSRTCKTCHTFYKKS